MPQVNKPTTVYKVVLTEYERGWGSKHWDTKYFDNAEEARKYALDYNIKNNSEKVTPDWYVRADYRGPVE
jgi:hypothetical protein